MAKFKVGDKVRVIQGLYPEDYYHPKIALLHEYLTLVGTVVSVDTDYPQGYLPDYKVKFEDGDFEPFDEVNLELAEQPVVKLPEPDQYVVDSALALHAFEILERIEAKLTAIEERLAAHEERANQSTGVVINVTGNVSMPAEMAAIAPEASAAPSFGPWLDIQDKHHILETFKAGDKVEFTGPFQAADGFIGRIEFFDEKDRDQFIAIVYDTSNENWSRWPDLSARKMRKVIE